MRALLLCARPFILATSFAQAQTLPEIMQQALEVHPEIQAAVTARTAAYDQQRIAQDGYRPKDDLTAGYDREGSHWIIATTPCVSSTTS